MPTSLTGSSNNFQALKNKSFQAFSIGSTLSQLGRQMLTVGIGWHIYELTHSTLSLGIVGLVQVIPVILLFLPAGQVVDSYPRKQVLMVAQLANMAATLGLVVLSLMNGSVHWMYVCLFLAGVGNAFHRPANASFIPQIVEARELTSAITWGSMTYQTACIVGPALGGLCIAFFHSALPVYLADFSGCFLFWLMLHRVQLRASLPTIAADTPKKAVSVRSLLSGAAFVWNTPLILAAISLDMFAVLFGGAITLLPVYAKDILHVGPSGLGWLQTAPSIGALLMGLYIARHPDLRNSGRLLLLAVVGFGIVTIVFGLSRNVYLSFAMLMLSGVFDNVSVVVRQALVQLRTPDEMRGRVSAINYVFIGTSNEMGGFESGIVAHQFGTVNSVVFGGIATVITVLLVALKWPELRRLDRLHNDDIETPPMTASSTTLPE